MTVYSGSLTFTGDKTGENFGKNSKVVYKNNLTNVFLYGETEFKSSQDIINHYKEMIGELVSFDISIETEDKIELLNEGLDGIYELLILEGSDLDFQKAKNIYGKSGDIVSLREAETSKKFGNRVIKLDLLK